MKTPTEYREMEFIELFIALARLFKPEIYVELGVKKGYTIRRMAPYVKKAIGVDINDVPIDGRAEWANITMIKSTTQEYVKSLADRKPFIDILFIDADHHSDAVMQDFLAYFPYVKSGTGLIFLHDTHPVKEELLVDGYCSNAWLAAAILTKISGPTFEIVTLPGPWAGLSIVRKLGKHHLAWKTEEVNVNS